MTSRTSPVGVVVLALAGVFAVGCSTQTTAVFEALLDPASAPDVPSEADGVGVGEEDSSSTWWRHPNAYDLRLPGGWGAIALDGERTQRLLGAIAADRPALADRIQDVLGATGSDLSMVAADMTGDVDVPPVVVVVSQPSEGRKLRYLKSRTYEQIEALTGLRGPIIRGDERLPSGVAMRYDFVVDDDDLGALRVRAYLFKLGGLAYIVSFVADVTSFQDAEEAFDDIVETIRFGV